MSSIEIQQTDGLGRSVQPLIASSRVLVAMCALLVFWVSFEPFSVRLFLDSSAAPSSSGNVINQLGFTVLFAVTLAVALTCCERAALFRLVSTPWLLMLAWLAYSVTIAPEPDAAARSYLFSLLVILTAALVVILPPTVNDLSRAFFFSGLMVLLLCYGGIVFVPELAIHQAGEAESQHAGFWRGLFIHKNITGPVMAMLTFLGIYLMRRGWHWRGILMTLAAFVFLYNTGSKTSAALVPIVILVVYFPAALGLRGLVVIAVVAGIAGAQAMTIGAAYVPFFDDILRTVNPVTTFTGRLEIWNFAKDYVLERPWTGYGFDGFWDTPNAEQAEKYFDQTWDPRNIVHGHNGILDMALQFGIPAALGMVWLAVLAPAIDYARTLKRRENALLADFYFMIVAFTGMNAALESFYFQRSDPVWIALVIAVFGLRLTSRFPIRH